MANSIQIAYGAIGWLQPTEDSTPRPVAMAEVARMLRGTGLDGLEGFGLADQLPADHSLGDVLKASRMGFSGAYASGSFVENYPARVEYERMKFERTVGVIAALGGSLVVVGGGRDYPEQRETSWPIFIRTITELAGIAKAAGVKLAYHPHKGTLVFTPEDIDRFVRDTESVADIVGLTLDTAHTDIGGADVLATFARYHSRTVHIHLKDVQKPVDEHGPRFVPLGDGSLPIKQVIEQAWQRGYRGWMTIELDASKAALRDARRSLSQLKRWLNDLGIPNRLTV